MKEKGGGGEEGIETRDEQGGQEKREYVTTHVKKR